MSEGANSPGSIDLRPIAAATAVVIGMVATAAVAYLLLDILLLLFIGIVVAAALQPWHVMLCRRGVPKGLAVLLIYLFLLLGLVVIALVVGPVLVEQAVAQVETIVAATAGSQGPVQGGQREACADNLDQATQRFKEAVQDVETLVVAAQEESRGVNAAAEVRSMALHKQSRDQPAPFDTAPKKTEPTRC